MKTIGRCFLALVVFLNILKVCGQCQSVRANRAARFVPEGGRIQMSCEVVHCGFGWNGGWVFQDIQSTSFTLLSPSIRIQLSNNNLTVNRTVLTVHIQNINQSDAGAYKCQISWVENLSSSGHVTYVNVTAASGGSSERSLSHRLMVCLGALTGFPLVLGLLWCLTKCHPSTPTVPPHPRTSFAERVKTKKEVVYAEVALNETRLQNHPPKLVIQPTIYSSLRF
ncbi:uncharacterized protein si:dkey-52l18.4 [Triplophysa dalaica]|uniref:uncharacterized protein si:dkey-52l18.4 n=1 Tax=Triplophysa dalaica TaxID=1582913 RepID=UPI0024DF6760|nr:uncharacterized protein si:dkey-52l18.4 [Triplophysa dalaica]